MTRTTSRSSAMLFLLTMGLASACRASTVQSYETCRYDSDCINGTDICVEVVHQGASTHLCTSPCQPASSVCPTDRYGATGTCVSFDSGVRYFCYQTCSPGSTLCEVGTSCVTVSGTGSADICLPGGGGTATVPAYSGCALGMVCQTGTACTSVHDVTVLELCTVQHCASDTDCPFDVRGGRGLCISLDGDSFGTCVERCNTTSDCTYGATSAEACVTSTRNGVPLPVAACLPR